MVCTSGLLSATLEYSGMSSWAYLAFYAATTETTAESSETTAESSCKFRSGECGPAGNGNLGWNPES